MRARFSPDGVDRKLRARVLRDYLLLVVMGIVFFTAYWWVGSAP